MPSAEIQRSTGATLGDVLQSKPGITSSGFAPGAASRPVVRGLDNYRVRIQENGLGINDVSDLERRPRRADRPTVGAAGRSDPRTGNAALRLAGDRRRGQRRQQPHSDLHPAARLCRRSQRRADQCRQRRRGRGAARRRQGQLRLPRRRLQPHRAGLPHPELPLSVSARSARRWSATGSPTAAVRADGQSVGGSYIFNGGFVGVAVSRFGSFYRIPGIEAAETGARIDLNQTKVTSKGEFRPRLVRDRHGAVLARRHRLQASTNWPTRTASTACSRPSPTGRRKAASKSSSCRSTCGLPRSPPRSARRRRIRSLRRSARPAAACSIRTRRTASPATSSTSSSSADGWRAQLAGRIERVKVDGTATDFPADLIPVLDDLGDRSRRPIRSSSQLHAEERVGGLLKDLPFGLVASVTAQYVERAPRAPELLSQRRARGVRHLRDRQSQSHHRGRALGRGRAAPRPGPVPLRADGLLHQIHQLHLPALHRRRLCDDDFASLRHRRRAAPGGLFAARRDCSAAPNSRRSSIWCRSAAACSASTANTTSCAPPSPTAATCRGCRRSATAAACSGATPTGSPASACCTPTRRPTSPRTRRTTAGYNLLKAVVSYSRMLKNAPIGPTEVTLGLVGDNLLNDDVRNAVSFKKDEVLLPGRTVRAFASVRF